MNRYSHDGFIGISGRWSRVLRYFMFFFTYKNKSLKIKISRGSKLLSKATRVGFGTNVNGPLLTKGTGEVVIGKYCALGHGITMISSNHDVGAINLNLALASRINLRVSHDSEKLGVSVGHNTWIGDQVIILPGVNIGNGCVIGAGSVVTKDIEDYSVACGCPARTIKRRFTESKREIINASQWWNLDESEIARMLTALEDVS